MLIDIVTTRQANLHNELVYLLDAGEQFLLLLKPLYAMTYRPVRREDAAEIEVWPATLAMGRPLPLLPLPLDQTIFMPLDLGATYTEACERSRPP